MKGRLGSVIGGKWRVEKALGRGGMAMVYSAVNVNNGFRVALKILSDPSTTDEETKRRFLREGYYANKVDHEGIASVMDDGVTDDGAVYLIMELLEGQSLEERRVADGGKIPLDDALDIILSVADVLAAAHDVELVHRDVKPENVFLTKAGRVKLLDFGIAGKRQAHDDATLTGTGYGTPMYMAPEQMSADERIDARVDVFALAATMYRILSGEYPFKASSLTDYLIAVLRTKPTRLDTLVPEVSPALAEVVARGLASEPDERYQDARAFAAAINKALTPAQVSGGEETVVLGTLKMHTDDLVKTELFVSDRSSAHPAVRTAGASAPPPPPPESRPSMPSVGLGPVSAPLSVATGDHAADSPPRTVLAIVIGLVVALVIALIAVFARRH